MRIVLLLLALLLVQCKEKAMDTNMKIHALRLKPGEDLKKGITDFVDRQKIEAGWIMTVAGSLTQTNLRFADQPEGIKSKGHFEIVSLTGTVSINGSHLHMSVSDSLGQTTGGHLMDENIIYTTAEIVIGESKVHIFTREKDGTTEWPELQIKKKPD